MARDIKTSSYGEALGVVVAICPFNHPATIPLQNIPIAMVMGNCLIPKLSDCDPGAAKFLAELAREVGFPKGVLNIIHGSLKAINLILDETSDRIEF